MKMKGLLIAAGVAAITFGGGRLLFNNSLNRKVMKLYSLHPENTVKKKELHNLPAPVRRYMQKALNGSTKTIDKVILKHSGFFKTALDKDWTPIEGEQHYTTNVPGFVWKGRTSLFSATDCFLDGKGNLSVWLFSAFKMIDKSGSTMDQAELLRWLGEGILYPTVLIDNEYISWSAINETSAKLEMNYNGINIYYIVTFNNRDEVITMETERYYETGKLEKWIGRFADYKTINGCYIPTKMEGAWFLNNVEYPYARFNIDSIRYTYR